MMPTYVQAHLSVYYLSGNQANTTSFSQPLSCHPPSEGCKPCCNPMCIDLMHVSSGFKAENVELHKNNICIDLLPSRHTQDVALTAET